jgi:Uncharacterised nucleotidyltransferase
MIATSWIAPDSCRDEQDDAVRRACKACPNWTEYLRLVDRHRTPALSWAALQRAQRVLIPVQVEQELQKRSDVCRLQAMLHLQLLVGVLKGLNHSGIPVMPLKGPLLSLALYGDAGLRQSRDLDILVPQKEIPQTQECLEKMGWLLGAEYFSLSPRQWEAIIRREYHIGFVHPQQGSHLELHWRNEWYSPQEMEQHWARSRTCEFSGSSYRAMSHTDLAMYLCNHGGVHQWFRAKWLGDLARMHCNGQVHWPEVLAYARTVGQERPVLLCLQLLSEWYDLAFPNIAGTLCKTLPYPLAQKAVRDLTAPGEPAGLNALAVFKERVRNSRYNRLLWPHRSWWKNLAWFTYSHHDFRVLRLPDSLFWLYIPLRPFLWLWRCMRRGNPTLPLPPVSRSIRP